MADSERVGVRGGPDKQFVKLNCTIIVLASVVYITFVILGNYIFLPTVVTSSSRAANNSIIHLT